MQVDVGPNVMCHVCIGAYNGGRDMPAYDVIFAQSKVPVVERLEKLES